MKLEGRLLLFDTINLNRDTFSKDCKITIPEKVPLTWDFQQDNVLGFAEVARDDIGLVCKAETFSDDIREVLTDGKIGTGGYYMEIKGHKEENLTVLDEARLAAVALVLAPVHEDYYLKEVEDADKRYDSRFGDGESI